MHGHRLWMAAAWAAVGVCAQVATAAPLRVVALHPIIADLAREVGGDHVAVSDLLGLGGNPHTFDPKPSDFAAVAKAQVLLLSGKGLEDGYLPALRDNMPADVTVVDVGRRIPSLRIEARSDVFVCCPAHSVGAIDPHWWHDPLNMQRAAREVASAFAETDPGHADDYAARARAYGRRMDALNEWVRGEIATRVPRGARVLTTSHAAFGYFCRAYRFRAVPVQGLNREQEASPVYLAETIEAIRDIGVRAVFPEQGANPKVLQSMVAETGVAVGGTLLADALTEEVATYEAFIRHNVATICAALGGGD